MERVNMAFGQTRRRAFPSWGVAPGYGEKWPSAKQVEPKLAHCEPFSGPAGRHNPSRRRETPVDFFRRIIGDSRAPFILTSAFFSWGT